MNSPFREPSAQEYGIAIETQWTIARAVLRLPLASMESMQSSAIVSVKTSDPERFARIGKNIEQDHAVTTALLALRSAVIAAAPELGGILPIWPCTGSQQPTVRP